jgi:hypothetical protein
VLYESGKVKGLVEEQHQLAGIKRRREAKAIAWNVCQHIGAFFPFSIFEIKNKH